MTRKALSRGTLLVFWLAVLVALAACGAEPTPTEAPSEAQPTDAPTQAPTESPVQTETPLPPDEASPFPPEMPSAVRGIAVYDANCATCHGAAGDGSGLTGAADFTEVASVRGKTPAEFFEAIRDGINGTVMPAWDERTRLDRRATALTIIFVVTSVDIRKTMTPVCGGQVSA